MSTESKGKTPRVSVVVPSYLRPTDLGRCLAALSRQEFADLEVLCVCRETDGETRRCVAERSAGDSRFKEVLVQESGAIAAYNCGLTAARGEFVSFTDDDAEAPPHWMSTIVAHLDSHIECGAVGGRDILQLPLRRLSDPAPVRRVGTYSWSGKFHATHHCPINAEFVCSEVIKGVNMTYRHALIRGTRIGDGLRGSTGAQVGFEHGLGHLVHRAGQQIHFLREAWVKHYCAPRKAKDDRTVMSSHHALDASFNQAYTLWRYQPLMKAAVVHLRQIIIGSRLIPGIFRLPLCPRQTGVFLAHFPRAVSGARAGMAARRAEDAC